MASAVALGDGLRLRSRRVRSGRSHRLSLWISIVVIAIAAGAGFVGVQMRTPPSPGVNVSGSVVDAATLEQQRFVSELRPIRADIQRSISETGLLVATYQSGGVSEVELQRRLTAILASYREAARQVDALNPPADMRPTVQAYRDTLAALAQSGAELSKAYDDGNDARVAAALAQSLRATAQLHDLGDIGAKRP
jgi:hypothetical protein